MSLQTEDEVVFFGNCRKLSYSSAIRMPGNTSPSNRPLHSIGMAYGFVITKQAPLIISARSSENTV